MGRNTQIMAVALILWAIGEGLWLYIQPLYLDSLGATPEQIGLILSIGGLARLFVMIPAGILADRFGARQVLLPGWILGFLGVITIAAAPNLTVIAFGYFLYGVSAMAIPVINLYLIQSVESDQSVQVRLKPQEILTFIHALFWLGVIISPTVGGLIAEFVSFRSVFWISSIWFGISTIAVLKTKAYPPQPSRQSSLGSFLQPYATLLRHKEFIWLYIIFTLGFIATILGFTFAPKYLADVHHLSDSRIGVLGSVFAFGSFVWNLLLGNRNVWFSYITSLTLTGLAFFIMLISGHFLILMVAYFILGGWNVLRPVSTAIMSEYTSNHQKGAAFGIVDTLHGVGTFLAPGIAGFLYAIARVWPFALGIALLPLTFMAVAYFLKTHATNSFESDLAKNHDLVKELV